MFQNATNTRRRSSCGTTQNIRLRAWSSSYWSPEERGWNPWQQRAAGRGNPHTSQDKLSLHPLHRPLSHPHESSPCRKETIQKRVDVQSCVGFQNTPGLITWLTEPSRTGTFVCAANQQRPGHVTTQAPPTESACTEAHVWQCFESLN